ncbi:hypothetical protein AUR64_13815 [Haloprofundus marisrubri]|uniref:Polyprenyl synthetase n=1 Tax=Haloprofundus marisrubri TaxID=1514971 RepID=A0A0W1R795_9EURY|nr:hypothetical protein [Haloprofundus marisrubri]KTG08884.1 hypothetical protein AUR64_13815 [Haloprofundus marisrubri]
MDDAVRTRDAAREALSDIDPPQLLDALDARLAEASMLPGALALVSARALDPDVDTDALAERAAGVQLIYEGLRLTRDLARDEPWADETAERQNGADDLIAGIEADMLVLAADVLVARGFFVLARTEAATRAVDTVRAFGHDQTLGRRSPVPATDGETDRDTDSFDGRLEADVLDLAVLAGATAVGESVPESLSAYAADLAAEYGTSFPEAPSALPEAAAERVAADGGGDDPVPSPTDS